MVHLIIPSLGRSSTSTSQKRRPEHFRPTPFITPLQVPLIVPRNFTALDSPSKRDPFARAAQGQSLDIYHAFASVPQSTPTSLAVHPKPSRGDSRGSVDAQVRDSTGQGSKAGRGTESDLDSLSYVDLEETLRYRSGASSLTDSTRPPTLTGEKPPRSFNYSSKARSKDGYPARSNMPPRSGLMRSAFDPTTPSDGGYETSASAPNSGVGEVPRRATRRTRRPYAQGIPEEDTGADEETDGLGELRVDGSELKASHTNKSSAPLANKKADKMLGLDTNAKLGTFYLVSGAGQVDPAKWIPADNESVRGMQPSEDALAFRWRAEILANAFSGPQTDQYEYNYRSARALRSTKFGQFLVPIQHGSKATNIPDAGPDAAYKILAKTLKMALPKDIEVINSSLTPQPTTHSFTFSLPRYDTLALAARARLNSALSTPSQGDPDQSFLSTFDDTTSVIPSAGTRDNVRNLTTATELTFHGVTLTVWRHADKSSVAQLKAIRQQLERGKSHLDPVIAAPFVSPLNGDSTRGGGKKKRKGLPFFSSGASDGGSETEGMSETDWEGPSGRRTFKSDSGSGTGVGGSAFETPTPAIFEQAGDVFWMPYSLTLVSRHPLYDSVIDYLRLTWAMYSKNAKAHMYQICKFLNYDTPRPGEPCRIEVATPQEPEKAVTFEAIFPGALDFDKGLYKVDFPLWPLFQALDVDHILMCIEIALSNSGRIIFCSRFTPMLALAANTLKYIVELRGWDGICIPTMHARDVTFIIEDPGPYIIGLSTECRYITAPPSEVVIVDLDTNTLVCKSPPPGVITPRARREKAKHKVYAALGSHFPLDRSVPTELKIPFPNGRFRPFNRVWAKGERPPYLGERLKAPGWWRQAEVLAVFDKIMLDKASDIAVKGMSLTGQHKKPTLIQRLTKSGMARTQAQLTVGEQLAKTMMRRRALHYVETRDDLEQKIARINERLMHLTREGERYKRQFQSFEKQADMLATEASELKVRIDHEQYEAARLAAITHAQKEQNKDLEVKLRTTEDARAEAMRQLSDMHQSLQDLEREREVIIDTLEEQISLAIDRMPLEDGQRDTLEAASMASPRSQARKVFSHARPATGDSYRSGTSAFTVETSTMSMMAMGRYRRERETSIRNTEMDRAFAEKSDQIAERIAGIASKFEATLSLLRQDKDKRSSISGSGFDRPDQKADVDVNGREEDGEMVAKLDQDTDADIAQTPMAHRRELEAVTAQDEADATPTPVNTLSKITATAAGATIATPEHAKRHQLHSQSSSADAPATPGSADEFMSATEGSPVTEMGRTRPLTASELGMIRPGVSLRIRRKTGGEMEGGGGDGASEVHAHLADAIAFAGAQLRGPQVTVDGSDPRQDRCGATRATHGDHGLEWTPSGRRGSGDADGVVTPGLSLDRMTASSTLEGGEILLSPSGSDRSVGTGSAVDVAGRGEMVIDEAKPIRDDAEEGLGGKRLSTISTVTLTFGQLH